MQFHAFFCILNSPPPCSGVLVSEKVVAQLRSLSYGRVILGNFWDRYYWRFMGILWVIFLRCSFALFYGTFMDDFFYDFQRCFSSASFRIEVPLIWFPFSISNNGFLNSMHCKFQISVIWKLEKVKVSKAEKVDVVAYAAYLAYVLSISTWFFKIDKLDC